MFEALLPFLKKGEEDDSGVAYPAGTPYKGVTRSVNFIDGPTLAAAIGLTAGTSINPQSGWLHFIEDSGLELYIAKKPLRKNVTWEQINAAINSENKEVTIGGDVYVLKFLRGAAGAASYAWNRYMYNVYNSTDRAVMPANTPVWGNYTTEMLGLATPTPTSASDGSHTICFEPYGGQGYVCRGNGGGDNYARSILGSWYILYNTPQMWYGWRPVLVKKSTIPLSPFRGEVAQADFLSFADLLTASGLTAGTAMNGSDVWLKFIPTNSNGKAIYFPKKPIRNNITWEQLNTLGLVTGTKTVTVGGKTYKIRLMLIAPTDTGAGGSIGREWADWMVGLTNGTYATYTFAQLGTGSGAASTGELNIGQETDTRGGHVCGGYPSMSGTWYITPNTTNVGYGWRPVLEEV